MRFCITLTTFLFACLAVAVPQAEVTPFSIRYDTGLRVDGDPIYLTEDRIGPLRQAEEEKIESLASTLASQDAAAYISEQRFNGGLDPMGAISVFSRKYTEYDVYASIAAETDSDAYRSLGAAYTASLVSVRSAFYATKTGVEFTTVSIEPQYEDESEEGEDSNTSMRSHTSQVLCLAASLMVGWLVL